MRGHVFSFFLPGAIAAGMICFLASCSQEAYLKEESSVEVEKIIIRASVEGGGSKVSINGSTGKFSWSENDRIAVHTSGAGWVSSDGLGADPGASADFSIGLTDAERDCFAVYPSSSAGTVSASALTVSYPASYALSGLNSEEAPLVMVAKNAPGKDLSFKHVGAILRLTVKDVPKGAGSLILIFLDKAVTGDFSVACLDSEPFEPTVSTSSGNSEIVFSFPSAITEMQDVVLNVPVPTGDLGRIKVTAADAGGRLFTNPLTITGPTLARAHGKKMQMYLPSFSVSAARKVIFAPGNLQATTSDGGSSWTWHFAEHQYDYIGNAAANNAINGKGIISSAAGTVDLFGWSTPVTNYGIWNNNTSTNYTGDFVDWGTLEISSYSANTWRTLQCNTADSADLFVSESDLGEMQYLIHKRGASTVSGTENARFIKCKLWNGTYGLLLFPDHYEHSTGQDLVDINVPTKNGQSDRNVISMENWAVMEAAGCVFLPYGGERRNPSGNPFVDGSNGRGEYWTGTPNADATKGNALYVNSNYFRVYNAPKCYGHAVRLVRDVCGPALAPLAPGESPVMTAEDQLVASGRSGDVIIPVSTNVAYYVSIPADVDWISFISTKAPVSLETTIHLEENSTSAPRETDITLQGEGTSQIIHIRQLNMHPVMDEAQLGCYGTEGVNLPYRPGSGQWSWRTGADAASFRLLDGDSFQAFVLNGLPESPAIGDTFNCDALFMDGFDTIVDKTIPLTVVDVDDDTFWLAATSTTGLVIKKNTL